MEEREQQSENTLQSLFEKTEVDDVKDFSHYIEPTENTDSSSELEEKGLSNIDKVLQKIQEEEKEYITIFEKFYANIPLKPQKPQAQYEFLTQPNVFYKALMNLGGGISHKFHTHIQMFLSDTDAKTQQVARQRIITSYWNFYEAVIENIQGEISHHK